MEGFRRSTPGVNIEHKEEVPFFLDAAYRRAETFTSRDALREQDFQDIYTEGVVNRDLADVQDKLAMIETQISQDPREKATYYWGKAVEGFVHQQINDNRFFGEHAIGIKTSEFDDLFRGVDEVVAFSQEGRGAGHLGLGIDVTFGNPTKKLERIVRNTRAGNLTKVKYFSADIPGWKFRGELETPHVVVGASRNALRGALVQWNEGQNDTLQYDPLKMLFLRQIADQLDALGKIAPEQTRGHYRVAEQYVQEAISQARSAGVMMGDLRKDPVHATITETMGNIINSSRT